jgi:MFS transporter, DHA2 family, multidrug resistance protein
LGKPDRRAVDRGADADQPVDLTVHNARGCQLHALWPGLAFYATPSTDAALSNLPNDQAGSGSGIYKMASSLGASFGAAISAAIFTALSADGESTHWLEGVITFAGRQDNVAVRQAALIALAFNLLMVVAAIVSIMLTVPEGRKRGDMR